MSHWVIVWMGVSFNSHLGVWNLSMKQSWSNYNHFLNNFLFIRFRIVLEHRNRTCSGAPFEFEQCRLGTTKLHSLVGQRTLDDDRGPPCDKHGQQHRLKFERVGDCWCSLPNRTCISKTTMNYNICTKKDKLNVTSPGGQNPLCKYSVSGSGPHPGCLQGLVKPRNLFEL